MDYEQISCGVAGQSGAIPADKTAQAKEYITSGIRELLSEGYRRFLVALTGEAALLFAEVVLSLKEQHPDAAADVTLPYDGWIDEQPDTARYKRVTAQTESVHYACGEVFEDAEEIANGQLIGFGRCLVVIHGGDALREFIEEARNAGQEVKEISIY